MYEIYRIIRRQALGDLSDNLGVSISLLKEINGFDDDIVFDVGDLVIIPKDNNGNDDFKYYTVKKGDTIISIARNNGLDYEQLLDLNGIDKEEYIYEGQQIMIPRENVDFWVVQDGNTLEDVASKFGAPISEVIMNNNKIYLKPEQLLIFKKKD